MSDKQYSYYYKEVEAAFARFKTVSSSMLPLAESLRMPDVDVFRKWSQFQGLMWSKHPSVVNLGLTESELSDDQKEEIALSNKAEFDVAIKELNGMCDFWDEILKNSEALRSATQTITNIVMDSVKNNLMYDYNGELEGDYNPAPLILTAEELYWALNILGPEMARLVLSEQSPNVFDSLYNAYQKGVEDFTNTFSNLVSIPMKGLRVALRSSLKDSASLSHFIETQLKEDKRLLATLANEVIESEDDSFSKILDYLLCGEPLGDLDASELLTSYGNLVGNSLTTVANIDGLSRLDKKQIQTVKESLSNELPNITTDNEEGINYSTKMLNIVTTLTDKWLVQKIHERAEESAMTIPIGLNNEVPNNDTMSLGPVPNLPRLDFPTRLASENLMSPSAISAQEQESVLREIYNNYGGALEDMSCEEFLFLFGAAFVKQPASYNPPYYWAGNASTMKALLRVLYIQQPRSLKELILHIADKETGAKGHDWSRNKNRVPYRDIEANIIKMVHRVTGKTLKEL